MLPALLIRTAVDSVRHDESLKASNPYSRCEETIKLFLELSTEQCGGVDSAVLEPAVVAAYWEEFFHSEDPLPDENEWREGLVKRSSQYDSFDEWKEWFKKSYVKVYTDNNIWMCVLMTSWAHTHQYEVRFTNEKWEFREASSYLPTTQVWRLEPHISFLSDIVAKLWLDEIKAYSERAFTINEDPITYLGNVECLGFDAKHFSVIWPAQSGKMPETIDVGGMVADVIAPAGDSWYRQLDNIIFKDNNVDVTSLINMVKYVFESRRRLFELSLNSDAKQAKLQATAEGWHVEENIGA